MAAPAAAAATVLSAIAGSAHPAVLLPAICGVTRRACNLFRFLQVLDVLYIVPLVSKRECWQRPPAPLLAFCTVEFVLLLDDVDAKKYVSSEICCSICCSRSIIVVLT